MTSVEYVTVGNGPGLVVLPGGTRCAHHYDALARALSGDYTVHVVNRRGRGASPPQDDGYGLDEEVADALEVLDETGSAQVFGHSYGGFVALHVALARDLTRLVAYEPAISLNGRIDLSWLDQFDELRARKGDAWAYHYFLSRMEFMPAGFLPRAMLTGMLRFTRDGREMRGLIPTVPAELRQVRAHACDGSRFAAITAPVLLLGGGRSPAYLRDLLPDLARIMPTTKVVIAPELDHNGPDLSGPSVVADLIRA